MVNFITIIGVYYYISGEKFDGQWLNDKKHGHGVFYFSEQERYDGEWENDLKCGKGKV